MHIDLLFLYVTYEDPLHFYVYTLILMYLLDTNCLDKNIGIACSLWCRYNGI